MSAPEIALLRRIADGRETEADRVELADRVRLYLEGADQGVSLDAAFDLDRRPGQSPWWRLEALGRRDAAIRALASRYFAGRSVALQAAQIRIALDIYASGLWRFDRRNSEPPKHYIGTPKVVLFDILRVSEKILSVRQIQRILSAVNN
ncbi:hypothetical protein ASF53_19535 [Methylobacterium sp. Leaf123]|uniref:hypothetical protein n=1 Tax=Methylobacterium sp. Leaf123 TaxID=1736264 RepID=UPI000701CDFC|nr:hypothetical protein [Methylobacterium sp. Leaf123]KQQ29426.1 hypothetical protein ASF53_19535 [Methylobacterium sp. Leaf123]